MSAFCLPGLARAFCPPGRPGGRRGGAALRAAAHLGATLPARMAPGGRATGSCLALRTCVSNRGSWRASRLSPAAPHLSGSGRRRHCCRRRRVRGRWHIMHCGAEKGTLSNNYLQETNAAFGGGRAGAMNRSPPGANLMRNWKVTLNSRLPLAVGALQPHGSRIPTAFR